MVFAAGRPVLAIPGPSPVPDRVLRAMHRAAPDIYAGELVEVNRRLMDDLRRLAGTRHNVACYIGNGHTGWQAALANLLRPGERALVLVSGLFGRGWAAAAEARGVAVEIMDCGTDAAPDPQRLADRLAQDRAGEIRVVMVCHVDTASGVRADLAALRAAMGDHPALFAVDAIASLGCEPLAMDDLGIDVLVSASQKGLMMAPGLAFVWFSERAGARAEPGFWDWHSRADAVEVWQFWGGTPPVQPIYGQVEALAMLLDDEGLPAVWARHEGLARATWAAVDAWAQGAGGIALNVAAPEARARAVTAVRWPGAERLRDWTRTRAGVTLGLGLGVEPPGSALRIAHMGHCSAHQLLGTLAVMQAGLMALGQPHGAGAMEAACAEIAARAGG